MKYELLANRSRLARVFTWTLPVVAMLAIAACGDDDDSASGDGDGTVAYVAPIRNDPYYTQQACAARDAVEGAGLEFDAPLAAETWSGPEQTKVLNAALATNPDAVILPPTDEKALGAIVTSASDDGVKFVSADSPFESSDAPVAHVQTNPVQGGREAAQELIRQLDGEGKVAVIAASDEGVPITADRAAGFEEVASEELGITFVGTQWNPDLSPEGAAGRMAALLQSEPDLAGVYTTNTSIAAQGAVTALKEAGRKPGEVKVVTMDADPPGVELLEQGWVTGLISNQPEEVGRAAGEAAVAAVRGEDVEELTEVPFTVVNADNVDEPEGKEAIYDVNC